MTSATGLREPMAGRSRNGRAASGLEHLGAYRPLIAAIREELERFVATDLRLHLAIAEHDRYVLTVHRDRAAWARTTPASFCAAFAASSRRSR